MSKNKKNQSTTETVQENPAIQGTENVKETTVETSVRKPDLNERIQEILSGKREGTVSEEIFSFINPIVTAIGENGHPVFENSISRELVKTALINGIKSVKHASHVAIKDSKFDKLEPYKQDIETIEKKLAELFPPAPKKDKTSTPKEEKIFDLYLGLGKEKFQENLLATLQDQDLFEDFSFTHRFTVRLSNLKGRDVVKPYGMDGKGEQKFFNALCNKEFLSHLRTETLAIAGEAGEKYFRHFTEDKHFDILLIPVEKPAVPEFAWT